MTAPIRKRLGLLSPLSCRSSPRFELQIRYTCSNIADDLLHLGTLAYGRLHENMQYNEAGDNLQTFASYCSLSYTCLATNICTVYFQACSLCKQQNVSCSRQVQTMRLSSQRKLELSRQTGDSQFRPSDYGPHRGHSPTEQLSLRQSKLLIVNFEACMVGLIRYGETYCLF